MKGKCAVLLLAVTCGTMFAVACRGGSTEPEVELRTDGLAFAYDGGASFEAAGPVDFDGGDLSGNTFAIAMADSVGGLVVTAFRKEQEGTGDLFIFQVTELRTGEFGPCSIVGDGGCHGRVLEDLNVTTLQAAGGHWEIIQGTAHLEEAGPDRVRGSFSGLLLEHEGVPEGEVTTRTIQDGTFDLALLQDDEAMAVMQCVLRRATGADSC
jgi:Cu/Zn superoxide dismutase